MAGASGGFDLARCDACRTLFTARLPEGGDAHDYDGYYHEGNLQVPAFVRSRLDEVVGAFEPYRDANRWLDVGCGAGTLLEAVVGRGWEAIGTEVSAGGAEAVRARGFDIRVGELDALALPAEGFDVVSLVEVVEHVPDPRALLADAARLVRPGGAVYVTTPHGRGISARALGARWSVVAPPEHLQLFSVHGMRAVAAAAGLEVVRLQTHAVNPAELVAGLRRMRASVDAGTRVDSGYRLNQALSANPRRAALKRAANAALALSRLGDSIRLVARRPH